MIPAKEIFATGMRIRMDEFCFSIHGIIALDLFFVQCCSSVDDDTLNFHFISIIHYYVACLVARILHS